MAIDLITGHQGVAHISAEQIAELQRAESGGYGDSKVMRMIDGGVTYAGLTITVAAGYWRVNGFDMEVQEAEEILIDPTTTGLSRIDNIYVEILQDIPTGSQRSEIVTVQGEAAASPVAPDAPTAPVLNTDILLQVTPLATVTVTEGAMVMTDLSVAYEMVTPQELAAVQTIAENAQTTANTANTSANNALGMIRNASTDAYSPSKAYKVGEHCIYNNVLYKCITACSAAAWSVNESCFEPTTLTSAVTDLNNDLKDALTASLLWENPNPTSNFNGQLLNTLSLRPYSKIIIRFTRSKTVNEEVYDLISLKGGVSSICYFPDTTDVRRKVVVYNETTISFGDGEQRDSYSGGWATGFNGQCIPLKIWGLK